jgi:hypothetical protein
MKITVLARGGLSVYGGSYDAKRDTALADTRHQQTVTITFPATITASAVTNNGLTLGTRTISTNTLTFTLAGEGSCEVIATMGDERPAVRIETPRQDQHDGYGVA